MLDAAHGSLPERMGPIDATATVVLYGPRFTALLSAARDAIERRALDAPVRVTFSPRGQGVVLRFTAPRVEQLCAEPLQVLGSGVSQVAGNPQLSHQ